MPKGKKGKVEESSSNIERPGSRGSRADLAAQSDPNVKIVRNVNSGDAPGKVTPRMRRTMERVEMLARPTARRLRSLWDEKCAILPKERRDKIKSALEEEYFLSPEQTEQYFQAVCMAGGPWAGPGSMVARKDLGDKSKDLRLRQKWLVNFSAQVAYRLCDYIAKGQKEMLVSNRLRSIADVVLERVAEILGEPKPSRTHPGRLARFMVAISDRIAVWIENAVYRADALEPSESGVLDEHIRLDAEKPLICDLPAVLRGVRRRRSPVCMARWRGGSRIRSRGCSVRWKDPGRWPHGLQRLRLAVCRPRLRRALLLTLSPQITIGCPHFRSVNTDLCSN